ncbi:50S ribosomal protein L25 [Deferrisoma camini]|uniref:50S ribosomal protein L25 n=1 Tax=Deferrisoma camini TaxID=1035120 RepID=UPI00046D0817|nr:50S ribosomal protein L25 [Deferrisoma camini]
MHAEFEFSVEIKEGVGKGAARKARAAGRTPGVVYGPEFAPRPVTFREQDLVRALNTPAQRNVFLRLKSPDPDLDGIRVIVKDLQVDPVKRRFIHADFYKLDPNRTMHATLPIHVQGTAIGVKLGGILQIVRREVRVACKPDDLPDAIVVDVTELKPGESVHVGDLEPPEGVRILTSPELAVCVVVAPTGYEEGGEEAEEEEAEA